MLKKKASFYAFTLVFIAFIGLTTALLVMTSKRTQFPEPIGKRQFELVKLYYGAEKFSSFVEQSAFLGAKNAIPKLAENGGFFGNSPCDNYENINLWRNDPFKEKPCFPTSRDLTKGLANYLSGELSVYAGRYTSDFQSVNMPDSSFDLSVAPFQNKGSAAIKISGYAVKKTEISSSGMSYSFSPSFNNVVINHDLFGSYEGYKRIADKDVDDIKKCLGIGSGRPDDDDLDTCTRAANFAYRVSYNSPDGFLSAKDLGKELFLKFKIKDNFEGKDFYATFGYIIKDDIPPPLVRDIFVNSRSDSTGKYILVKWAKSPASDVVSYEIFEAQDSFLGLQGLAPLAAVSTLNTPESFDFYAKDSDDNLLIPSLNKVLSTTIGSSSEAEPAFLYAVKVESGKKKCYTIRAIDSDGYKSETFEPNKCIEVS